MRKLESSNVEDLLAYLFDGQVHLLSEPIGRWLASSRRFTAFVGTFRDKIRKKLRVTQEEETLYDLRLELETAFLLLREKSLSLVYEPDHSKQGRKPDFAVTYTTSLTFMIEVTRLREVQATQSPNGSVAAQAENERLADAICSKLGQLLAQRSNVLLVGMDSAGLSQNDLQTVMLRVKQRAEGRDPTFWQRYGFRDRADFFNHYQRLSEVLMRRSQLQAGEPIVTWMNPQAKHPLPSKVRTALYRSHRI